MKILVTGAAGFIGSHLCESLIRDGHEVYGIDNFDPFYPRPLKEENLNLLRSNPLFHFFEGDICDLALWSKITKMEWRPDCIVHLAALAGVQPSRLNQPLYWKVNVEGTLALMEWARTLSKLPSICFASSSSVYGDSPKMPLEETDPVDHPISPYAATKKTGELLLHNYAYQYGFKVSCLRFFTVYGPRQRPDLAIRKFAAMLQKGEAITLYGNGDSFRDYTFISDIIEGIKLSIKKMESARSGTYEIYNLGNGKPLRLVEMVKLLEESLNVKAIVRRIEPQPGDVHGTFASLAKTQSQLGYSPRITHQEGFKKLVNWLVDKL